MTPQPNVPRIVGIKQGSSAAITLDGTLPFSLTPARDGSIAIAQGVHNFTLPTSAAFTVTYKGSWPADPPPPPRGNLTIDLSYVDKTGPAYARFKGYVDAAIASGGSTYDIRPIDCMYMYKLDGGAQYANAAIAEVEANVTAAETISAAGGIPAIAGDDYLGVGEGIAEVSLVLAWANSLLSASQKTRYASYCSQAVYNIWHYQTASWYGHLHQWSNWSTNNPFNNYYYSFIQATMFWALASNDAALLTFLRNDRLPLLSNAYATLNGGGSFEGTGYGASHKTLFDLYEVWRDCGQGDLRNLHETNSVDFWVHGTVPTMDRFVPIGDQSRVSEPWLYDYHRALVKEAAYQTTATAEKSLAGYWFAHIAHQEMENTYSFRYDLIPYIAGSTPTSLTYRAPEVGACFARTAWTIDATWIAVLMGQFHESHAHREQGGFTLFHRNWATVTNNIYSQSGIHQDSRDKNILRFERNGVVKEQDWGTVNVTNYSASGGDMHISGDLTSLYQVDDNEGVQHWDRTIDFVGGVTTVVDNFQLAAGTNAIFQLQLPTQPSVSGNVITTGNLRATVVSPANAQISVVTMSSVDSNYQSGYRVDIRGSSTLYKVKLETL